MNKFATPILIFLTVVFGAFAIHQYQQAEHSRALLAQKDKDAAGAREEADLHTTEIRQLKDQTRSQKVAIEQLETRNKELANGAPVEAAKPATADGEPGKEEGGGFMKGFAKMFSDPKMKSAMRAQQATAVNMMYAELAKELGLAPDVARQVLALLGDRQADLAERGMAAMSKEGGRDLAQVGKDSEAAKAAYDDQLQAILGEAGYKKFQEYEKTIGERASLDQIQRQLAASGNTIEPAQAKSLIAIMTEERAKATDTAIPKNPGEQMKFMQSEKAVDGWMKSQEEFNRRVLERARTVLNPDQMLGLEAAQKQQLEMQKMGIQMSKEMFKGK